VNHAVLGEPTFTWRTLNLLLGAVEVRMTCLKLNEVDVMWEGQLIRK
jgi:hypothetical protein